MSHDETGDSDSSLPNPGPLDDARRAQIFEVWQGAAAAPPGSISTRVEASLATNAKATTSSVRGFPTRLRYVVMALPVAAALALWGGRQLRAASGEIQAAARETVQIGGRGTAVLEADAHVQWDVSPGNDATIRQHTGDVFYRVEKGGRFSVQTPAGEVRAVGTCFRVEVVMNGKRQTLLAGASGAALAAAVVVSVYEGKVLLAGDKTAEPIAAGPGERLVMEGGNVRRGEALRTPRLAVRREPGDSDADPNAPLPPPEELPAKYRAQSEELARLRAQIAGLRPGGGFGPGEAPPRRGADNFVDPSREELLARAQTCTVAWDSPPLDLDLDPSKIEKRWGLSSDEASIVAPILSKFKDDQLRTIRDLYVEVTGAKALAEQLSPRALTSEIKEKAAPGEVQRAYQQISGELAGTIAPPGPQHRPSAAERLLRLQSTAGERFERAIAAELGAARARELRKKNNGWNSRVNESMGCPRAEE